MAYATTSDGTKISYSDHGGSGSPVLLVHGITESAASWEPIVERLAASRRVLTMDLRGHGASGLADRYDLEAMASDVAAVVEATNVAGQVHLVGHSLGGAVVSAAGAALPVASVVDVDQSLQLGAFKAQLGEIEMMLRDPATFGGVIDGMFRQMAGDKISAEAFEHVHNNRRPNQDVVLGVWELLFTMPEAEISAVVDQALAAYAGRDVPYLALFGIDPGDAYADWLGQHIAGAQVELWAEHGHYPHLVDPDRFVARLQEFWA
ncbi:UNVERIFIED_CONTAM: hypothetical protein GTU68_010366 [Idotea baltica]|nr:hypothetical protein [Idotea baltica]